MTDNPITQDMTVPLEVRIQEALDMIGNVLGSFPDPIMVPLLLAHATAACIRWARDQESPDDWKELGGVDGFLATFNEHVKHAIDGAESQELGAILRAMQSDSARLN